MKDSFNVNDYLPQAPQAKADVAAGYQPTDKRDEVETVINRIESAHACIAPDYSSWVRACYALISEFGEGGRDYFRRISRFWNGKETRTPDKQYDACMKSKNRGGKDVTIATFFELAKQAGVDVTMPHNFPPNPPFPPFPPTPLYETNRSDYTYIYNNEATNNKKNTTRGEMGETGENQLPTFAFEVKELLPNMLQEVVTLTDNPQTADLYLLGSMTTISSVLPNYYTTYAGDKLEANMLLDVFGKPTARKGVLGHTIELIEHIHQDIHQDYQKAKEAYQMELKKSKKEREKQAEMPKEPMPRMKYVGGNITAPTLLRTLATNKEGILLAETESETVLNMMKQDYGNYTSIMLKAFHHERLSIHRSTDRENEYIGYPRLSVILCGTDDSIPQLFRGGDTGLFSRFLHYYLPIKHEWVSPRPTQKDSISEKFKELGEEIRNRYYILKNHQPIYFSLTEEQWNKFDREFTNIKQQILSLYGENLGSNVHRLGVSTIRMAMIMAMLRFTMYELADVNKIQCTDDDLNAALQIAQALLPHITKIYKMAFPQRDNQQTDYRLKALANMKEVFTTGEFAQALTLLNDKARADKSLDYLQKQKRIEKIGRGKYKKL